MAAPMIPPAAAPDFLAAHGWEGAEIRPLAGDASFRRYFRVHRASGETAVLMDAPPEHEDIGPFLTVAGHLLDRGFRPPRPLAIDRARGLLLLEDFGDERVGPFLQREPERERGIYEAAVDILVAIGRDPAPADLPAYDDAAMAREVGLFTDWYAPAVGIAVDEEGFLNAWRRAWRNVLAEVERRPVMVLRDYHADNLMVLPGTSELGLLDFQDALAGHRAYDLVSLLQDARRDVAPELEEAMLERYVDASPIASAEDFRAHYELLGAQRNTKILGIFTRLWKRDGKPHYLALQPRVWGYLERNLAHPALTPVREWFEDNLPHELRAATWRDEASSLRRRQRDRIEQLQARLAGFADRTIHFADTADLEAALRDLKRVLHEIEGSNDATMIEAAVHLRTGIDLILRCRDRDVQTSVGVLHYLVVDPCRKAIKSSPEKGWELLVQTAFLGIGQVILANLGILF